MVTVTNAKRVLNDAQEAFELFQNNPIDVDFRHTVVLNITLLRTIGSVIKSENKGLSRIKSDKYFKDHIENEEIFKNFIKYFRDLLVKEYLSKLGWSSITDLEGNNRMEYLIQEGLYAGKDIRNLIQESLQFWTYHLNELEKL